LKSLPVRITKGEGRKWKRRPKISIQQQPIANLEHPFAISTINSFPKKGIAIDNAKGCSKLAIGCC
jgi:hypothetical protein